MYHKLEKLFFHQLILHQLTKNAEIFIPCGKTTNQKEKNIFRKITLKRRKNK